MLVEREQVGATFRLRFSRGETVNPKGTNCVFVGHVRHIDGSRCVVTPILGRWWRGRWMLAAHLFEISIDGTLVGRMTRSRGRNNGRTPFNARPYNLIVYLAGGEVTWPRSFGRKSDALEFVEKNQTVKP